LEPSMNDQKIELSLSLVNAVLQYLGSRPYAEIFQLVQAIQAQAAPQVTPAESEELAEAQDVQPESQAA
jgi:hypothetical protein